MGLEQRVRALREWWAHEPERALQRPVIPSQGERWRAMRPGG
ncbi:hypothetical protein EV189_1019 [Motilibacter rhizosphaerae]|uniref:Uncharacterized protein n=1 Tax=Motilibacter rhizosphaerae TaxID=598652 RepID=A0A4Q7NWR9_9ACTN|nr:hypothetical protein [Motilibacter rhizosphaerae]RZS91771.1 hypothetical protein EV189_1019 [Motilibacter rhizosphaerae]